MPTGEGADHSTIQGALSKAFPKAMIYHHGNNGAIMSAPDDDANSADHTMNKMDEMTPEAIILGGISPSDLSFHRLGDLTYMHSCKT